MARKRNITKPTLKTIDKLYWLYVRFISGTSLETEQDKIGHLKLVQTMGYDSAKQSVELYMTKQECASTVYHTVKERIRNLPKAKYGHLRALCQYVVMNVLHDLIKFGECNWNMIKMSAEAVNEMQFGFNPEVVEVIIEVAKAVVPSYYKKIMQILNASVTVPENPAKTAAVAVE